MLADKIPEIAIRRHTLKITESIHILNIGTVPKSGWWKVGFLAKDRLK
jgi:hypothetical protein